MLVGSQCGAKAARGGQSLLAAAAENVAPRISNRPFGHDMIYRVTARFKKTSAAELRRKLLEGTIAEQQPDGPELVDSMNRAVVKESGEIEWSEMCYCSSPLAHERQTVLDQHFDEIATEVVSDYEDHEGRPFMDYLNELAEST